MKTRRGQILFLILFATLAALFLITDTEELTNATKETFAPILPSSGAAKRAEDTASGSTSSVGGSQVPAEAGNAVDARFVAWFEAESSQMEKSAVDPQVKEASLREAASKFTSAEILFLKERSLNLKNSANDRILSIYLLTLAPDRTASALSDVVIAPLNNAGDYQVHSPEETLAAQEKSLRRMGIDALIDQAKKDPALREKLAKTFAQIPDASLREYAEKSLEKLR